MERFKNVGTTMKSIDLARLSLASLVLAIAAPQQTLADSRQSAPVSPPPSYADLADLADAAPLVAKAQVRKVTPIEPARARNVRPGHGRFLVEARTQEVLFGRVSLGEALKYLVDLPLDAKGKPANLKKRSVLLFARPVPARPGELQLVAPDAQLVWDAPLDGRMRALIGELTAPGAAQRINGVREAIHVPGNLTGEGETQLFLATADGEPAAITVRRSPGQPPAWGVSFSEVVGESGAVPQRDTLAWYRLACFLPATLPSGVNLSGSQADRLQAGTDYRFVMAQLGPCPRIRAQ